MNGGFNPMQMFGQAMGNGGNGNPMQMLGQMMGGGNGNPMGLPFTQGQVGGMNPQQIMQMANQIFGGKAPTQSEIQAKMNELESQGKVMVINSKQMFDMIQQGGGGKVVRYANIPNPTIMTLADYNNLYGGN